MTKLASRPRTTDPTKGRVGLTLKSYETNLDLEIQQRAVEFASLFGQTSIVSGVLEEMPPPEVKQTVVGGVGKDSFHQGRNMQLISNL